MESISEGYDKLWKEFIKPTRNTYSVEDLGPKVEIMDELCFLRKDLFLPVSQGNHIVASFFHPAPHEEVIGAQSTSFAEKYEKSNSINVRGLPCLIYCHSHNGNRVEGKFLREFCMKEEYCLFLFDFLGHGQSEGEYSSLGYFEKFQLDRIVQHLRDSFNVGPIALWGRSMGAVTCLRYAEDNGLQLCNMVLDSPFTSLIKMCQDVAREHYSIPKFLINLGIGIINGSIQSRIHVDLFQELVPLQASKRCSTAVRFITGEKDGLVTPKRVGQYMKEYGADLPLSCIIDKDIILSQATHTENREDHVIHQAFQFVRKNFMGHSVQIKKIDSHLWDMRRYKRFKPCKWPEKKLKAGSKQGKDTSKPEKAKPQNQQEPKNEAASHLEVDFEHDPFSPPTVKRSTRINPVHAKAHFNENFDHDPHNQQSTKSSDEIRGHSGHHNPKASNNGHQEEIVNPYHRGYVDLPFDPREQRLQNSRDNTISDKTRPMMRANSQAAFKEPMLGQGDRFGGIQLPATSGYEDHFGHHRGNSNKPLHLKENHFGGYVANPIKHSAVGLGGFGGSPQTWHSPPQFKRSDTNFDPSTSHLQHFGNPYYRKQKSSYAEIGHEETTPKSSPHGIQLRPQPGTSGQNYFAQQNHMSGRPDQKKRAPMFDDDDLSIFLDDRYRMLENKEVQVNGTLNLDDSMVHDLNTLNVLLKAKPH
jgi:pimeloyl-ACP methyl ester carboxylesterase